MNPIEPSGWGTRACLASSVGSMTRSHRRCGIWVHVGERRDPDVVDPEVAGLGAGGQDVLDPVEVASLAFDQDVLMEVRQFVDDVMHAQGAGVRSGGILLLPLPGNVRSHELAQLHPRVTEVTWAATWSTKDSSSPAIPVSYSSFLDGTHLGAHIIELQLLTAGGRTGPVDCATAWEHHNL